MEEYKAEVEYHFSAVNNELYTLKQGVANGTLRVVGEKVDLCSRNNDIKFEEMGIRKIKSRKCYVIAHL